MSRNLLHKTHLEDFKAWLAYRGTEYRPGRGDWQVLQVKCGQEWQCVYHRIYMPEHLTVAGNKIEKLVRRFYDDRKRLRGETE